MAKKKKENEEVILKEMVITQAFIKDDLCNYSYEIKSGTGVGNIVSVKGKGIIDEDLRIKMYPLTAHLAVIDDSFKRSGIEVDNISKLHNHELSALYTVTGFKVVGEDENKQVVLIGQKEISCSNSHISIETPKIPVDNLSSYTWHKELKKTIDACCEEVELYHKGKCTSVEVSATVDANQMTIADADLEGGKID